MIAAAVSWSALCLWQAATARQEAFDTARNLALEAIHAGISPFGITPQGVYADILQGVAIRWLLGTLVLGGLAMAIRPRKSTPLDPGV